MERLAWDEREVLYSVLVADVDQEKTSLIMLSQSSPAVSLLSLQALGTW